jgi:hypothetical protein
MKRGGHHVEERLKRMEEALLQLTVENRKLLEQLLSENRQLREQFGALEAQMRPPTPAEVAAEVLPSPVEAKTAKHRVALSVITSVALVPVLAYTVLHMNAVQSMAMTAVNALLALLLYFLGPVAGRLLMEGLMRAIPTVLFGQATRLAIDKWRKGGKAS